jgi:hypothetical protein
MRIQGRSEDLETMQSTKKMELLKLKVHLYRNLAMGCSSKWTIQKNKDMIDSLHTMYYYNFINNDWWI